MYLSDEAVAFLAMLAQANRQALDWADRDPCWAIHLLADPRAFCYACRLDGVLVGAFVAHPTTYPQAHACHAAFMPASRRASLLLARLALARFWSDAPDTVSHLLAWIPDGNLRAAAMARAAGFARAGQVPAFFAFADGQRRAANVFATYRDRRT